MDRALHYGTVTEAIESLREEGYLLDFNIESDHIVYNSGRFGIDDFEIKKVYRYEGDSDPADEAAVYAIESSSGMKGILVTGYGIYSDTLSERILKKLSRPQYPPHETNDKPSSN
ncbi:hypothetical protein GCM10023093_22140 [Nemorincola caseinilytica]|uniref:Phosphoribosylpyrophosphate synthetase n=1 Tax=Nemorincola caseinilytica TaxID=2054315 RepID=A0ABP8NJR8_9BACT